MFAIIIADKYVRAIMAGFEAKNPHGWVFRKNRSKKAINMGFVRMNKKRFHRKTKFTPSSQSKTHMMNRKDGD